MHLIMDIQAAANRKGIFNVPDLVKASGRPRQGLYPIWNGTAESISLENLAKLCRVLEVEPGDWFRWEGDSLIWQIAEEATARGLQQTSLSYRAEVHHRTITPIWLNRTTMAYLSTLSAFARVFHDPQYGKPFAIGGFFSWVDAVERTPSTEARQALAASG